MWHRHTRKYYVTSKMSILTFTTKRTAPENMGLEKDGGHKRTNVL